MLTEHRDAVTLEGEPLTLVGNEVKVGDIAPDFMATDFSDYDEYFMFSEMSTRKVCLISSVATLETSVCTRQTRRLADEARSLGDQVFVISISAEPASASWRDNLAHCIDSNMIMLADTRGAFGRAYGLLIKELQLNARCLLVIDRDGIVRYKELVRELTNEPDYEAALKAVRELVNR